MVGKIKKAVALKIDVDTHDGMRDGVPVLLEILEKFGAKGTFCLSFGPDNAGKAIYRLFREPAFLKKMVKTGAPKLYGLRTVLSGTLLPARPIATAFPGLVRQIEAQGHEVIVHAWDHRKWQDHLPRMTENAIEQEFDKSFKAFREILKRPPRAVAAPGWQVTPASLTVQDRLGLDYASDLRQGPPCFLSYGQKRFETLQIPTTGPCIEELLTMGIKDETQLAEHLLLPLEGYAYPVLALHAEVEGGPFRDFFEGLMARLLKKHGSCLLLRDIAKRCLESPEALEVRELRYIELPGRAGKVASSGAVQSQ